MRLTTALGAMALLAMGGAGGVAAEPSLAPHRPTVPPRPRVSPGDICVGGWAHEHPWARRRTVLKHNRRPILHLSPADQERVRQAEMKRARKAAKANGRPLVMSAPVRETACATMFRWTGGAAEDAVAYYPGEFQPVTFAKRPHPWGPAPLDGVTL